VLLPGRGEGKLRKPFFQKVDEPLQGESGKLKWNLKETGRVKKHFKSNFNLTCYTTAEWV